MMYTTSWVCRPTGISRRRRDLLASQRCNTHRCTLGYMPVVATTAQACKQVYNAEQVYGSAAWAMSAEDRGSISMHCCCASAGPHRKGEPVLSPREAVKLRWKEGAPAEGDHHVYRQSNQQDGVADGHCVHHPAKSDLPRTSELQGRNETASLESHGFTAGLIRALHQRKRLHGTRSGTTCHCEHGLAGIRA
jgi:hypothetical protein